MNEKLAMEILKQANIETTVGCCKKCPRKDKNKTCIGCLDDAKDILLNYAENLQSKIDKAIEYCEEVIKEHNNGEYNVSTVELAVKEHKENIENVLDILKGDK